jgi:hypothetical protein
MLDGLNAVVTFLKKPTMCPRVACVPHGRYGGAVFESVSYRSHSSGGVSMRTAT